MTQFTMVDTFIVICYMIVLICVGIWISYKVTGNLYGIALAAVGMLSTTGITVAYIMVSIPVVSCFYLVVIIGSSIC